jgi:hypothetical protein
LIFLHRSAQGGATVDHQGTAFLIRFADARLLESFLQVFRAKLDLSGVVSMSDQHEPSPSSPRDVVYIRGGLRVDEPDGGYSVTSPSGISVSYRADGDIEGMLPVIRALSVADISKVIRHNIARVYETVSHTLHFEGGGVLSYMHSTSGQGYEFRGHNVCVEMDSDGMVIVYGTSPH